MAATEPRQAATLQCLADGLRRLGSRRAVGVRLDYGARWWTREELYRKSVHAACLLAEAGVGKGDRYILWLPNEPEWLAFFLGAAWLGAVTVPVDAAASVEVVEAARKSSGAKLILFGKAQNGAAAGGVRKPAFSLEGAAAGELAGIRATVCADDPAVVLFTSGVSGEARGVVLTHGNLMLQTARFGHWRHVTMLFPVRFLTLSPLSHVQGLMLGACVPLHLAVPVFYTPGISAPHLIRTIRDGAIFALCTVPRVVELLEDGLRQSSPLMRGWRRPTALRRALGWRFLLLFLGGATMPESRERFWKRGACLVVQGYGTTETTAFVTVNRPLFGRSGSIGHNIHRDALRLAEDGEILVRGAHLSPGYLDGGPLSGSTPDGFVRTGDLARMDSRGRLFFLGRKKDLIVTAEGHNIHPSRIEAVLRNAPGVRDAVAMSLSREGLEELHAVLLLNDGVAADGVIQAANRTLETQERIRSWTVWPAPDFPRAQLQKVRRDIVQKMIQDSGAETASTQIDAPEDFDVILRDGQRDRRVQRLARAIAALAPVKEPVAISKLIHTLELDSIDVASLLTALEFRWGVSLERPGVHLTAESASTGLPAEIHAPRWQGWPGMGIVRSLCRTLVLRPALFGISRISSQGVNTVRLLKPPVLFAMHTENRHHSIDFPAIWSRLPRHLSRRIFLATGTFLYTELLQDPAQLNWKARWVSRLLLRAGTPAVFPFAIFPACGQARDALLETGKWVSKGYSALLTWGPGMAVIAQETMATIVPVVLAGNEAFSSSTIGARPPVRVVFGTPVYPSGAHSAEQLDTIVQTAFHSLSRTAASGARPTP